MVIERIDILSGNVAQQGKTDLRTSNKIDSIIGQIVEQEQNIEEQFALTGSTLQSMSDAIAVQAEEDLDLRLGVDENTHNIAAANRAVNAAVGTANTNKGTISTLNTKVNSLNDSVATISGRFERSFVSYADGSNTTDKLVNC